MNEALISSTGLAAARGNVIRWKALRELPAGEPLLTVELSERVETKHLVPAHEGATLRMPGDAEPRGPIRHPGGATHFK